MSKVFNMVGGGGKNISSIIITGGESTDTVTCTKDGKTYPATWDDTDQHWEIVGLPLGTFTVTATNGTKTTTENVLIDISGVYEIEMTFKLWLYRDGDECEDITGGWVISYGSAGVQSTVLTKNTDNMYISYTSGAGAGKSGGCGTANTIDLTQYTKLCVKASNFGGTNDYSLQMIAGDTNTSDGNTYAVSYYTSLPSDGVLTCDISNVNNSAFIRLLMQANKWANIHQVWIE